MEHKYKKREIFIKIRKQLTLRKKMFLIYICGGFLPMLFVSHYLILGTQDLLVQQSKISEISELELIGDGMRENIRTIIEASQKLYFDNTIEKLAFHEYTDRKELLSDVNLLNTKMRKECLDYWGRQIEYICLYFNNETLMNTLKIAVINDWVRSQDWFQKTMKANGRLICAFHEDSINYKNYLSFSRILRTVNNVEVGVAVVYMKEERIQFPLQQHDTETLLVINKEEIVYSNSKDSNQEQVLALLKKFPEDKKCSNVTYMGEEAVLTVVPVTHTGLEDELTIVSIKPYEDILKKANLQSYRSILIILFSFIVSITIIIIFAWNLSNRITTFKNQMHKASKGDFNIVENIGGDDEISYLYNDLGAMIDSIESLISKVYEAQVQKEMLYSRQKEMEFCILASQINPHFLYNTLETIRMKARANGMVEIEDIVKMLANIMRHSIQTNDTRVTLEQELMVVENYLRIQKYRFGERITYSILVDDKVGVFYIVPLIIQPIVENAIVHGMELKKGKGHIDITVKSEESIITITVTDDGVGIEKERLEQIRHDMTVLSDDNCKHIGLRNVNQRIKLLYGQAYGVMIESTALVGTSVTIILPS